MQAAATQMHSVAVYTLENHVHIIVSAFGRSELKLYLSLKKIILQ